MLLNFNGPLAKTRLAAVTQALGQLCVLLEGQLYLAGVLCSFLLLDAVRPELTAYLSAQFRVVFVRRTF